MDEKNFFEHEIIFEAFQFEHRYKGNKMPVFTWLNRNGSAFAGVDVFVDLRAYWSPYVS